MKLVLVWIIGVPAVFLGTWAGASLGATFDTPDTVDGYVLGMMVGFVSSLLLVMYLYSRYE